jgi:hypothetical protein
VSASTHRPSRPTLARLVVAVALAACGGSPATGPTSAPVSCDIYCATIMTSCTGASAQYADEAACRKACSYWPLGAAADTTGDTVACRSNALRSVGKDALACAHAGPLGHGTCGDGCEAFCAIALGYCSAAAGLAGDPAYPSLAECQHDCLLFARATTSDGAPDYFSTTTNVTGDTLECRAYHLIIAALESSAAQLEHCNHAASSSDACGPGPDLSSPPPDGGTDATP